MKQSTRIANYISGLTIGQGRRAGQSFKLHGWQRRFLSGAFGQPGDAALSMGRGNGKTTFAAAIACAAVDVGGPLVAPMAECLLVASSFDQGLIAFRHMLHFLAPTLERHGRRFRIQDSANRATITDRKTGAMVRVLGSDPRRLHGAAPKLLLLDEVAQWPPERVQAMLAALRTSRGKIPDSRALWLGTRPAAEEHPFERALNGHGVGFRLCYAAPKDAPPFHRRTWKKAQPRIRSAAGPGSHDPGGKQPTPSATHRPCNPSGRCALIRGLLIRLPACWWMPTAGARPWTWRGATGQPSMSWG